MGLINASWICDHGTAEHQEDGIIAKYPFYGVVDGFSAPHSHLNPPLLFNGKTGGEMIIETTKKVFQEANHDLSLKHYVSLANIKIEKILKNQGFPLENAGIIPGASFIFLKIEEKAVNLLQGGDCLSVWRCRSGKIGFTPNKAYSHVSKNLQTIHEILEKNGGDRKKLWVEFFPVLSQRRQQDINNLESKDGYAVLNGQPALKECWRSFAIPTEGLETIILFSDGFIPYVETADDRISQLAKKLLSDYREGFTLENMLDEKRKEEVKNSKTSYITHDEATAIVLKFDDLDDNSREEPSVAKKTEG